MIHWGINALNHGSSLAVFKDGEFVFNRFDRQDELNHTTIYEALHSGAPDRIFWYERPWIKKARQAQAGQWSRVFDLDVVPSKYLKRINLGYAQISYTPHHASHAAAGYYTSPFNNCAIVVLDAIGEFECASIWHGSHNEIKKVWHRDYPNSLGLFYSAFTDLLGMKPIQDEFLLQQMSDNGDPNKYYFDVKEYMGSVVKAHKNMHKGIWDWPFEVTEENKFDIAAAVQEVFEEQVDMVMRKAKELTGADSLVYMGGCAMNSKANRKVVETKFDYIWSLPQPGDPSSSIGAVLYHTKQRVWNKDLGVVKHIEVRV